MGIPPTPGTTGLMIPNTVPDAPVTPINILEVPVTTTPPVQVNTIQAEPAPEPLMLEPIVGVPMQQPGVDSQLGGSYITNVQTENVCNVSLCNVDSVAHEYLKSHFNERLNDKVDKAFKDFFGNINTDSIKEALPKVSVNNNIIAKYVEEINLKYGIKLSFRQLEVSEVSTWAKTFQFATTSKDKSDVQQHLQPSNLQQSQDTQYV